MTIDLSGCQAKVERADEHLNVLYAELQAFFKPYSNRRIVYHARDGAWHVILVRPPIDKPPPLRLSIICGDVIHNLRSALDHLVWQLVLAEGNKPGKWNSFPIYSDSKDFDRDIRLRKKKRGRGPLEGIDSKGDAWAAIENAQPYRRANPGADPLAMLNALDVIDKHRTLLLNMLFPKEETIWDLVGWDNAAELLEYRVVWQPLSVERETQILQLRFSDSGPDPQMRVKGNLAIEPTFGDAPLAPTDKAIQVPMDNIAWLHPYVRDLIGSFEPFYV
jgi:hypothetical protein